jgi:hypothetical protein
MKLKVPSKYALKKFSQGLNLFLLMFCEYTYLEAVNLAIFYCGEILTNAKK